MQISIGSRFFRLPNVFRQDVYAVITGKQLRDAVISGANSILKNRKFVDDLNIFPVPDGDTGHEYVHDDRCRQRRHAGACG